MTANNETNTSNATTASLSRRYAYTLYHEKNCLSGERNTIKNLVFNWLGQTLEANNGVAENINKLSGACAFRLGKSQSTIRNAMYDLANEELIVINNDDGAKTSVVFLTPEGSSLLYDYEFKAWVRPGEGGSFIQQVALWIAEHTDSTITTLRSIAKMMNVKDTAPLFTGIREKIKESLYIKRNISRIEKAANYARVLGLKLSTPFRRHNETPFRRQHLTIKNIFKSITGNSYLEVDQDLSNYNIQRD